MPTMQEYLEEMARRQATGWTPGVPTRYTGALPTSYPAFSNLSALWAGSQPKANLGDIAAASADPKPAPRRGRPRTSPEKLQSISDRQGTGTLGKTVKSIAPMLSAISKVAGPAAIAYDALRSDPAVASTEVPPGGYFYESQAYPSMAVEEGYPNVSTLPSFDVTPDAGGAIGGVPGEQPMEKYGPSGYEGESIPPSGYRQIAPDSVIAASDFEVGPTSMAQVGTNAFGIPDKSYGKISKTHSELLADTAARQEMNTNVTNMINKLGNTVSYFPGAATTPKDVLDATKSSTALSGTAQDYNYSHPFQTAWYDHPYLSSEDAMFSQGMKQKMDYQDSLLGGLGYSLGQPFDEGVKLTASLAEKLGVSPSTIGAIPVIGKHLVDDDGNVLQPASLAGTVAQMAFPMAGVQQDNIPALVDDIVERTVLNPFGFENPLATSALADPNITAMNTLGQSFEEVAFGPQGVGGFRYSKPSGTSLPVTPPDSMLMQDFIDKYGPVQSGTRDAYYHRDGTVRNAAGDIVATDAAYDEASGMGQVASHPGQGGHIGGPTDPDITIPEMLARQDARTAAAVMAPRQDAMPPAAPAPQVTAPIPVSAAPTTQRDIMPAIPAGPSPAELELQHRNRVAAQEAQAAIERVAQAQALMSKYGGRREPAENYMSAAERDVMAAAQVDTFAGLGTAGDYDGGSSFAGNVGNYGGMGGFEGYR